MTDNRIERVLAFLVAVMFGIGLVATIAIIVATTVGADFSGGLWPVVFVLPGIALPLGFVLLVVVLVRSAVRRNRASRDAGR